MKRLVVATKNKGKLNEIKALLDGLVEQISSAADYDEFPETVEDGLTFKDNALKKAREAAAFTGFPALADDSGLVVNALDGRPGVFSARFAGENADDGANIDKLLYECSAVPEGERQCAFVCVLAYVTPDGDEETFFGQINGSVLVSRRGTGGFGYDPVFLVDGFDRTMAELTTAEKNSISHRATAFAKFKKYLQTLNR